MTFQPASRTSRRLPPWSSEKKPAVGRTRAGSASALVYSGLRAQIVALERRPGDPLLESEVTVSYGVSRTPVREAVLKLAAEGLVEIFPQSGTFVSRIPIGALPEAIIIRKALEEMTARLAALRATRSQIIALRSILERQREVSAAGDRDGFHRADEAFHAVIAEAAGHPGIWTLVQQVKVQVDRYRRLTLPQEGRMARVIREHAAVIAAIEVGDAPRAALQMGVHLDGLLSDISDIRRLNPDFFTKGRVTRADQPARGQRPHRSRRAR